MNRKERRAAARLARKQGLGKKVASELGTAVEALQGAGELPQVIEQLQGVLSEFNDQQALLNALVEDYQALANELELQREINLRLLACIGNDQGVLDYQALQYLKNLEQALRERHADGQDEQAGHIQAQGSPG